jgi:hypothetical protein
VIYSVELCPRQRHVPSHAIPGLRPRHRDVLPRRHRSWRREKGPKVEFTWPKNLNVIFFKKRPNYKKLEPSGLGSHWAVLISLQ